MIPDAEIQYLPVGSKQSVALALQSYPGGEPLVTYDGDGVRAILLRPSSMQAFLTAMFFMDALMERDNFGNKPPRLILPQVPGARQDRKNDSGDFLFTAKSVASMINARGFRQVALLDPHSDVAPALIERSVVFMPKFPKPNKPYAGIIAPDGGAIRRAHSMAAQRGIPVFHGWKKRDVRTGTLSGFGLEPLGGLYRGQAPHYLVVDDLCDAGGTFIGLADEIHEQGATADLWVTHGLFTKGTKPLLDCYEEVYCSDSVVGDKPGVSVSPLSAELLEAS